ncbi:MAG: bifunctional tetrahydrofolate synthase/dihydrofolate synthase [Gammaproteobacteria bacterium]|nr:MAG: bifunctional tetrahydrofolate synthase/dihydrofolate synthase [Gammaproteobacteria bacterium]
MASCHPQDIELGLDRTLQVANSLQLNTLAATVVTVAGTNGKGSTVRVLESIYQAAGYRTAAYTSPHLCRYNERVHINTQDVDDALLCLAFEKIEHARGEIPLTYFEFGTLAALWIFQQQAPEIVMLEVGLGGRLDAVNIIDADVSVVTTVDIDHTDWLGHDRAVIAREKGGIFRKGRPAVCGQHPPVQALLDVAREAGASMHALNDDYSYTCEANGWTWRSGDTIRNALPFPVLRGDHQLDNAATVLMVVELLKGRHPVSNQAVRKGLLEAVLAGRYQVLPGHPIVVLDVAHNPEAARSLRVTLEQQVIAGRTLAVAAMLADKAIAEVFAILQPCIDSWYLAALDVPRGASSQDLDRALGAVVSPKQHFKDVNAAYAAARVAAGDNDRILVFGSFHTVGDILVLRV